MSEEVTDLTRGVYRRVYAGYLTGQRINKLSLNAEAWFWRVYMSVDDFGNGRADPELLKAATAGPRKVSSRQVSGWLMEMRDVGLIEFYTGKGGEPLLHIVGFEESQPAGRNGKRIKKYPLPGESGCIQVNPEKSGYDVSPDTDTDTDTHTDTHTEDTSRSKAALVRHIFEFWKTEMKHPKAQLTPERKKKIEERLADSAVDEIEAAIRGCKASDFHMGREHGHPQVFDDIELICRKRSKLESFIAKAPALPRPVRTETVNEKLARESCERCFGTGTERVPGKGARNCDHGINADNRSGAAVEGITQHREARVS